MKDLTERQLEVLNFMKKYHVENNKPPSIRAISRALNLSETGSINHIVGLRKKGFVSGMIAKGIITKCM